MSYFRYIHARTPGSDLWSPAFFPPRNLASAPALTSQGWGWGGCSLPTSFSVSFEAVLFRVDSVCLSLSLTQPDQNLTLGFGLSPRDYATWLVVWDTVKSLPALNLEITCGVRDIVSKTQKPAAWWWQKKKTNKKDKIKAARRGILHCNLPSTQQAVQVT